jgi:excisionase family DNA binding protein
MPDARALHSPLLTRDEAARYCRVGLRTFDRRVAPHVRALSIGARILFDRKDIDTWLETQKDGRSLEIGVRVSTRSASRTRGEGSTDPRAQEILQELRSKRRESTPRLFPVADCKPEPNP